jgi:uncharacterized membrane-anchored protein
MKNKSLGGNVEIVGRSISEININHYFVPEGQITEYPNAVVGKIVTNNDISVPYSY